MKEAMRDKVCQLIGKYQAEEAFHREKSWSYPFLELARHGRRQGCVLPGLSEGPRETAGGEVNSDTNGGRWVNKSRCQRRSVNSKLKGMRIWPQLNPQAVGVDRPQAQRRLLGPFCLRPSLFP